MKSKLVPICLFGILAAASAYVYVQKSNTPKVVPAKSLFDAAIAGDVSQVKGFLSTGKNIDEANARQQTPLIGSLVYSHPDVAQTLIESGANIKSADDRGLTAIHYAAANNLVKIVSLLVDKGADINVVSKQGFTPMNLAKAYGSKEAVAFLQSKGAKDIPLRRPSGKNPSSRISQGPG